MSRYNYYQELTIDGYGFPNVPQSYFGFISRGFSILNKGSYVIEYSFDGTNLHGSLATSGADQGFVFDNRFEGAIFFRSIGGYGTVRVEAWGI